MPPFAVLINGGEQLEGEDKGLREGGIVFNRQIVKERVGTSRSMFQGHWATH